MNISVIIVPEAARNISTVYSEGGIIERTAWMWLSHFKQDNFDLNNVKLFPDDHKTWVKTIWME